MQISPKFKAVAARAIRMFLTGAASTALTVSALITVNDIKSWHQLGTALAVVSLSLIVGGINGLLAGADKLIRWDESR